MWENDVDWNHRADGGKLFKISSIVDGRRGRERERETIDGIFQTCRDAFSLNYTWQRGVCEDTKMGNISFCDMVRGFLRLDFLSHVFSFENFRQSDCLRLFKCIRRLFFLALKIARI